MSLQCQLSEQSVFELTEQIHSETASAMMEFYRTGWMDGWIDKLNNHCVV